MGELGPRLTMGRRFRSAPSRRRGPAPYQASPPQQVPGTSGHDRLQVQSGRPGLHRPGNPSACQPRTAAGVAHAHCPRPRRPSLPRARARTPRPRARSRPPPLHTHTPLTRHARALVRSAALALPPPHPPPSEAQLPDALSSQPLGARPPEPAAALTSSAPGPSHRTLPLACLADGGSGGSGDSDPGVRGTGAQAGSDLPGRFRSRLSLSSPSQAATATSPL